MSTDIESELSKYPGLGDLPILGTLFRSQEGQVRVLPSKT